MADRAAIHTIRGYFYQFDYTIEIILNQVNETDPILIEGVEDIDVSAATETTAIQCKYYQNTEYNHSEIAEPIRLMLNHFKDVQDGTKARVKYKLRGFYASGHSKLTLPINVQCLKDTFLTYTRTKVKHEHHEILNLNDLHLAEFLELLEIDIHAKPFETQFRDIIQLFKSYFTNCSDFAAEHFYYNNALRVIRDLAKETEIDKRRINKRTFLDKINTSSILFHEWFIQKKGEKAHFNNLRNEFFSSLNISYKERFFLLEINQNTYSRDDVKEILYLLIKNYTKIKRQPKPFSPYVYLHGIEKSELIELKNDLIADGKILIDGFDFEGASYNPQSHCREPSMEHPIELKFVNHLDHLKLVLQKTGRISEIYQFYINSDYFEYKNSSIKEVKIQIKQLNNIKNII